MGNRGYILRAGGATQLVDSLHSKPGHPQLSVVLPNSTPSSDMLEARGLAFKANSATQEM